MKFSTEVHAQIMSIIQSAMLMQKDASQELRDLDLVEGTDGTLVLSEDYKEES